MKHFFYVILLLIIFITNLNTLAQKNIAVLGTGYVGLIAGACFADFGNNVICADIIKEKIDTLNNGEIPIYEPGLKELVNKCIKNNNLKFTIDLEYAIKNSEIILIAVGTPMADNGQADLSAIKQVAEIIGKNLNNYKIICTKSTVPIGTGKLIKEIIKNLSNNINFDYLSNPEFLREGSALKDFLEPDRVIIGCESIHAYNIINEIYEPLINKKIPFLFTDVVTAETIKYASNSFLATKVSFINEIAELCEKIGANIELVAKGMGLDSRIGTKFLKPGPGFGGSCFPKDMQALIFLANNLGLNLKVLQASVEANEHQRELIINKLLNLLNYKIKNKKIGILGLAFKANTDDIRCSPSIDIIKKLLNLGAKINAYDPVAMNNTRKVLPNINYCQSAYEAIVNVDAILILTEWPEFMNLDLKIVGELVSNKIILDSRNILDSNTTRKFGFKFDNIGNA